MVLKGELLVEEDPLKVLDEFVPGAGRGVSVARGQALAAPDLDELAVSGVEDVAADEVLGLELPGGLDIVVDEPDALPRGHGPLVPADQ